VVGSVEPPLSVSRLPRRDRRVLGVIVGGALVLQGVFVWLPALASVALSFTSWDGIGGLAGIHAVGLRNYELLLTGYPRFWTALLNNIVWLVAFVGVATPLGMGFAWLLDRELRGARFYAAAFYLPVLLSLALVGLIWQLQYAPEQGFINNALGRTSQSEVIDWLGDRSLNRWAVIVAASWRQVGYVMVLYLAGLRTIDPAIREAAAIDGASEWQAFRRVVIPALRPVNAVVLVITTIEALRAFDIVYVINGGLNGLELLSTLVTANIAGEASRLGFGSAIATVLLAISVVPIALFLRRLEREEEA
jgi:ABC-type sugar transport system permease subunit